MAKYRKKPVVIDAVQITNADFNGSTFDGSPFSETPDWLETALQSGVVSIYRDDRDYARWQIKTLEDGPSGEAKHVADPGDWIIKGVVGELYFCKPDIFRATYEAVVE